LPRQSLPPRIEGLFREALRCTELLHGHPAPLLRRDSLTPILFPSPNLSDHICSHHATNMQRDGPLWKRGLSDAYAHVFETFCTDFVPEVGKFAISAFWATVSFSEALKHSKVGI
jgi:hypothetical protein